MSIVIPAKDHVETLDARVISIAENATYANYEIFLVKNNSEDPETFAYYEALPERVADASDGKGAIALNAGQASLTTPKLSTLALSMLRVTTCCCSTTTPRL
ncbi:MAG: hypothetical protein JTJ11_05075 [Collinsella sp.]|nr:hypothetical protein [Collinsella sp.]